MRQLWLGLTMATLVMARPELYREKEDFQYSRSSSDEGSKSGYYDAQRGNMGGNYERAHNMDGLAQHQMGGLVKQVEGELGDGSKTRTGSVFSSANSRGVYGSGHYDLSNLAGRNFQEGVSYGDSQFASSSSLNSEHTAQSSSQNNARYSTSGRSLNSNYRGYDANNLQGTQNLYNANQFEEGMQAGYKSQYRSQSGYEGQNLYQQRVNTDQLTAQNMDANSHHHRLISTVPVKIIVRPGQTIAIPLATQTHSGSQIASHYDHSSANNDAEVFSTNIDQQAINPSNSAKHYESSYSYRKQWEKHNTKPEIIPLAIPTVAPIPENSELYDDSYQQRRNTQYSSNRYDQNANFNAASSHSRHQSDFEAKHHSSAASNSNVYTQNGGSSNIDTQSANLGTLSTKPKSYQSSYSYHKSWERQGDPYIIKPASNGVYDAQTSSRLTDASDSQNAYSSYNYGSRKSQNQYSLNNNCIIECDPSRIRVARSYSKDQFEQQSEKLEDLGQQTQEQWSENTGQETLNKENLEDLGQQTQSQWGNLADFGQQTQDQWSQSDHLGQQSLNKEKIEDLSQQTQNEWSDLADIGQQTQSENFGQQSLNKEKIEDLGQQTQNQWGNLADLGQQTQDQWTQSETLGQQPLNKEKMEDLGQQTQNQWGNLADLGQQTQDQWTQSETLGQQPLNKEKIEDLGQQTQNQWGNLADLGQQTQDQWTQSETLGQQPLNKEKIEDLGQHTQNQWSDLTDLGQQTQDQWTQSGTLGQQPLNKEKIEDLGQQTQNLWGQMELFGQSQMDHGQHTQDIWENQDKYSDMFGQQTENKSEVSTDKSRSTWDKISEMEQTQQSSFNQESTQNTFQQHEVNHEPLGIWNVIHNNGQTSQVNTEAQENSNVFHSNLEQNQTENTSSLNGLWGKLDDLDDDYTKYDKSIFTQDINFQQHHQGTNYQLFNEKEENKKNEPASAVSNVFPIEDVKLILPKTEIEKQSLPDNSQNNNEKTSTTTKKPQDTNSIRPIDVGRGDIGPEESPIETLSNEPTYSDMSITNDKEESSSHNKNNNDAVYHNLNQESISVGKVSSVDSKLESGSIITKEKETEEMTTELISPQESEVDNYGQSEQSTDFAQENQQFIDSMKYFESQNSYQHHSGGFSQHESDQQINWNAETQNVEQTSVNNLSATGQAIDQNFDKLFNTAEHENLQVMNTNPMMNFYPIIPKDVNEDQVTKEKCIDEINQQTKELDQQINWNAETQNVEKHQFINNFSDETQATVQSFDQQFVTAGYQSQSLKEPKPQTFTPEVINEAELIKEKSAENKEGSPDNINKPDVLKNHEVNIPDENSQNKESESSAVTEKPGFWKNLGSKFSNAKSKVASWFGS